MCVRKQAYYVRKAAVQAMAKLKKRFGEDHLNTYRCPYCNLWHVGHKRRKK